MTEFGDSDSYAIIFCAAAQHLMLPCIDTFTLQFARFPFCGHAYYQLGSSFILLG